MSLDQPLRGPSYLAFPLRVDADGPRLSARAEHVRELIEQVLETSPGERAFRPEWGGGVRSLVFEPATSALREVLEKRLRSALAEVLAGEVDPRTLLVEVAPQADERLEVLVSYTLATIGRVEEHRLTVGAQRG